MPAPVATPLQNLTLAYQNYTQILVLVTAVVQNPTQANVDTLVAETDRLGVLRPKPTYSVDGESWDWTGYQQFILDKMLELRRQMQLAGGAFMIPTRFTT
jgi:hypothetical protein